MPLYSDIGIGSPCLSGSASTSPWRLVKSLGRSAYMRVLGRLAKIFAFADMAMALSHDHSRGGHVDAAQSKAFRRQGAFTFRKRALEA